MRRRTIFEPIIMSYGNWEIDISVSSSSIDNTGGTTVITSQAKRYIYWSNKNITEEIKTPLISVSSGTLSGNTLTLSANTSNSIKTITITAVYDGVTKTLDITLAGKAIISYSDWSLTINANPSTGISAAGGTSVITSSASRVITWTDNSTTTETATPTLSTNLGTISSTTLTLAANQDTSIKTATITASHGGKSTTCTVKQNADSIASYGEVTLTAGTVADIPASGGSVTSKGSNASLVLTWVSKKTTTVYPTITEGTLSNIASKGITFSNRASVGKITITATGLGNKTASKELTVYQSGNYVVSITPLGLNSGNHFYYTDIEASGGDKTPTLNGLAVYTFSSGATTTQGTGWTTNGTATFSRTYSGTLATGFTKIDSSTGTVTASNRTTTLGDARSLQVNSVLTVTFVHSDTYKTGGTVTGKVTHSATCTLKANNSSLTGVRIAAILPDNSWLATSSWNSIPASGHYIGVNGYYIYTWSSGSTSETSAGNLKTGLTYTTSMAEVHTNGGLHILDRGTTYGSARSGTVYWTYNSLKSNTLSFSLVANTITITSVTSTPGTLTNTSFNVAGETKNITATGASASAVLTFSSGSKVTTYYNSTDYGSWTFHGYSGSSNLTYATVGTVGYDKVSITMSNNTSTSARSAVITRTEAGFTFTLKSDYGGSNKKSTSTSCTCTVSLVAGAKQYGSWTGGSISFSSSSALSAGTDSRTVTIKPWSRTWGWNAASGGGTEYYTGNVTVSENGDYTSIDVASYTASSSNKTLTLSKSTCGTTTVAATTVTITAKGATTTTGSLSLTANGTTTITYGTPSISTFSYANKSAAAGSVSPSISYSQSRTLNYTSGSTSALSAVTSGASLSYSETTAHSEATVNATSGAVTWTANTSTSSTRSCGITVTVTINGKSGTKAATSTLEKDSVSSYTYANPTVTFNDYGSKNAAAGTIGISATPTYNQVRTNNYVSGNKTTTNLTSGGTISYSGSATGATVNTSNGTITWTANTSESATRSVTVTATVSMNGKSGSDTATSIQAKDGISSYTYANPTVTFSVSDIPSNGGEIASGTVTYNQVRTNNYVSGKTATTTNLTSGGTVTYSTKVTASSLGTTVKARTKVGTLTATVTMNSKSGTKTVDVYQAANAITSYGSVTVTSHGTASDIPAAGGDRTASGGTGTLTITYTSGSTRAGTVTCGSYTKVSASTLGTTFKIRTKIGTSTATLTGEGSKTASVSVDVYQLANNITSVNASNTFTYSEISAGATSATPTSSHSPMYVFTSGASSTTTPATTYGSLTTTCTYSIANTTTNGFTACDSSTGTLTATSRGTTYGASSRQSAKVTKTLTYKWKNASTYGGNEVSKTNTYEAYCSLGKNVFTNVSILGSGPTISGSFTAAGGSKTVSGLSAVGRVTLYYSSGKNTGSLSDWSAYGSVSIISHRWSVSSSSSSYVTLSSTTVVNPTVTVSSRDTTYSSDTRSISLTYMAGCTFTTNSNYGSSTLGGSFTKSLYTTQAANTVTALLLVNGGAISSSGAISAGGGNADIRSSTLPSCTATIKFASGSTTTSYSTYGTLTGPTYSWMLKSSTVSGTGSTNNSIYIPSLNDKVTTSYTYYTVQRRATYTFTFSSTYGGNTQSSSGFITCSVSLNKNTVTTTTSNVSWSISSISTPIPKSGGTYTLSASVTYDKKDTYSSGTINTSTGVSGTVTYKTSIGSISGKTLTIPTNSTGSNRYVTLTYTCSEAGSSQTRTYILSGT